MSGLRFPVSTCCWMDRRRATTGSAGGVWLLLGCATPPGCVDLLDWTGAGDRVAVCAVGEAGTGPAVGVSRTAAEVTGGPATPPGSDRESTSAATRIAASAAPTPTATAAMAAARRQRWRVGALDGRFAMAWYAPPGGAGGAGAAGRGNSVAAPGSATVASAAIAAGAGSCDRASSRALTSAASAGRAAGSFASSCATRSSSTRGTSARCSCSGAGGWVRCW